MKDEEFEEALWGWAEELAAQPTASIGRTKQLMNQSLGVSFKSQLTREKNTIAWSATTKDFSEKVTRFVKKKTPLKP